MTVDTQAHQDWCSVDRQEEDGSVLKESPASQGDLESKEIEDRQVYQDLQEHQDFQLSVVVVSLELQASQEREVRRETSALQGCLCLVPQDVQGLLEPRVNQGSLDLQALPQEDNPASVESPGVLVCRERGVTLERRARKVTGATPV